MDHHKVKEYKRASTAKIVLHISINMPEKTLHK